MSSISTASKTTTQAASGASTASTPVSSSAAAASLSVVSAQAAAPVSQLRQPDKDAAKAAERDAKISENRWMAGLSILGGSLEIVGGLGFTALTGGVGGALGGGAAVLDGSMRVTHGIRDLINGEKTDAPLSVAAQIAGADQKTANRIDAGIGLAASLTTGGLGVQAALKATTALGRTAGVGLAANSLNGTYRGADYVASGEQNPTWANQAASALGATSPVANAYASLGLNAALMSPGLARSALNSRSAPPPKDGQATPATTPASVPALATAPAPAPGLNVMASGEVGKRPPSLRDQMIEQAGEREVVVPARGAAQTVPGTPAPRSSDGGQQTLDTSIQRQLAMMDKLPAHDPVKLRALAIEKQIVISRQPPEGMDPATLARPLAADQFAMRRALAFSIANNPVANRTWMNAVEGVKAPGAKRPEVRSQVVLYSSASRNYAASYRAPKDGATNGQINILMPAHGEPWHNQTITGLMSFFTHEGHHASPGPTGVNKPENVKLTEGFRKARNAPGSPDRGRSYPGTLDGEYQPERRAHLALQHEVNRATGDTATRLSMAQRTQIGQEINYKVRKDNKEEFKSWSLGSKAPMGNRHIEPNWAKHTDAQRNALRAQGQMTLHDANLVFKDMARNKQAIDKMLDMHETFGTSAGRDWMDFATKFEAAAAKVFNTHELAGSRVKLAEPAPISAGTASQMRAEMDTLRARIIEMKANGGGDAVDMFSFLGS